MAQSYDLDAKPTAQEAIKRISSGFSLSESAGQPLAPKDDKSLKITTFSLQGFLKEKDFATEFLERGGLPSLCDIIMSSTGNTLAYALNSFLSLMEHNTGWEELSDEFVARVVHIVVTEQLATIARPAIAILLKLVCANEQNKQDDIQIRCYGYHTIHDAMEKEPTLITVLVDRLLSQEYLLSTTSMSLLTAMLRYVTDQYRSTLSNAFDHSNLRKNVLRLMNNHPSTEMKALLLDYQAAVIQNISSLYGMSVSAQNPRHNRMLQDILEAADIEKTEVAGAKRWKKVGFTTEVPQRDFSRTGVLGLEEIHHFAVNNKDLFAKMILEQIHRPENKRCPFARASVEVTELLCSHWNINSSNNSISEFQPLIHDFKHVHSTTLQTYFRIFHDMEATIYDFSKVEALVRSQLRFALNSASAYDINEFDRSMFGTPYQQIKDRRLKELEWADDLLGRDAISNLRTRLSRQSYEFIKKQRISCLLEGAWFPSPLSSQRISVITGSNNSSANSSPLLSPANTSSNANALVGNSTNKRWRYYKLSRSKRSVMYGDFSEKIAPVLKSYEKLPHRIDLSSVSEIRPIRKQSTAGLGNLAINSIGGNSPQQTYHQTLTDSSGNPVLHSSGGSASLSFALCSDKHNTLAEFHCATATQAAEWKDGFSMLLDKRFTSKETAELFHTLTEVGVKVKLLQIAGDRVEIPHSMIEVPPVPPGLGSGFFYNSADY
ncbi:Engulfment and cell motility protein 2 [Choanephora cucurbitarum]|uniref:Engulfment and cell motility protein 2 n=1 Tax=Choanephora cucurbitarum TaxID=101091 RepID=A0A1C7N3U4_9FUNG|nr:Engulfment and cell motility protein 2 [Choanephora cucurbitarum]